jgi:hypothetical protein
MPSAVRRILFVSVLVLAILACNLPIAISPTQDPGAPYTAAAQTVAAAVNQTLVPSLTPPSLVESSTPSLVVDTFTPLPTLSPTPILTATSSIPLITVSVDTNCRVGPGKVYDYIGGLYIGQTAEVHGKNSGNNYWYIRLPENPGIFCWITGQYATIVGNTAFLPIFTPPPTPTPMPSFELSYAGLDSCVGWWVEVKLKNTGPIAFKSMSISVKDRDTGTTLTDSENGFTDIDGCLASGTTASLDPGSSYSISSPGFVYNPDNHKMRVTVTLCSLINQGGQCVSNTIDFKP